MALGYTPVTWANGSGGGTALSAANLNQMEDGVEAAHANAVDKTLLDAKGDILAASAADTPARLAVGTNGQVLTAASGETTGLQWATPSLAATIADAKGDLIAATAADTLARLAVGTDGQVLTADSGETTGLAWATPGAAASIVRKTADESVTSSTTLQDDDHLVLAVDESKAYIFDCFLMVDGASAGDLKVAFTVPAGAVVRWSAAGPDGSAISSSNYVAADTSAESANFGTAAVGTHTGVLIRGSVVTAGTAGNLQLQWAQVSSSGSATTLHDGSWLRLEEDV